jgi:hypothetical protein
MRAAFLVNSVQDRAAPINVAAELLAKTEHVAVEISRTWSCYSIRVESKI